MESLVRRRYVKGNAKHLTFTALEAGTFSLNIPANIGTEQITSVEFSVDDGRTWTKIINSSEAVTITTPAIAAGKTVLWKGSGISYGKVGYNSSFSSTGKFDISGFITSLLYNDNYKRTHIAGSYNFYKLFASCKIVSARNLILPTNVTENCFCFMFYNCSLLTKAPELGQKIELSAPRCFHTMFGGCTSLEKAPELPSSILSSGCYCQMFMNCTALTKAPKLPAKSLITECYSRMFAGCTNLNEIEALFITEPGDGTTQSWLSSVKNKGTFIKNRNATWNLRGDNGIPNGWTIVLTDE